MAVTGAPRALRLPTPSLVDVRALIGLLLVVGSVLGVAWVVTTADDTVAVWALRSDLAAGATVAADDVTLTRVQLGAGPLAYLPESADPVGQVVVRDVTSGELLASSAVRAVDAVDRRLVTVPVERYHLAADLRRGERVDVYVVERGATGQPVGEPRLVLGEVTVEAVDDGGSRLGGSSLETGVVLSVAPDDVSSLVGASAGGALTLVRVPGP